MKKLIFTIVAIAFSLSGFSQTIDIADLVDLLFEGQHFPAISNDTSNIGKLQTLFSDSTSKESYLASNPKLSELFVIGTFSSSDKKVLFSDWIKNYVKVGQYDNTCTSEYSITRRTDGVTQEFLMIESSTGYLLRQINISRYNESLVQVCDSELN